MASSTYQNRKASGICVRCGKRTAEPGRMRCAECAEKHRVDRKETRAWLLSKGYCPKCGKERLWGDEKVCLECAAKRYASFVRGGEIAKRKAALANRKHREKMKDLGRCIVCGKPAVPGKGRCKKCAEKNKISVRRIMVRKNGISRYERVSAGLCYICGAPLKDGKRTCEKCGKNLVAHLGKADRSHRPRKRDNISAARKVTA